MASTSQKREWYKPWECNRNKMERVSFPMPGGANIRLLVADVTVPAWELFAELMRKHSYYFREMAGGTYNCRNIAGTNKKSLHSYGIAIDLNPSVNSFGQTSHDFPQGFIDDVLETGLFRWGQSFKDPMHWEIDVPPDQIGDDVPLSNEDIDRIAERVWYFLITDPTTGQKRGAAHHVASAYKWAYEAAQESGSGASAEAVADEIARRLEE